jgi:hypothetical protein
VELGFLAVVNFDLGAAAFLGAAAEGTVYWPSPVFAPKSSMNSWSFSSKLLFQTMTTLSLPPVVK